MSRRRVIGLLVVRWGFAILVASAIASGLVASMTVTPEVPASRLMPGALQATVVYRMEVGAAVFFGLYAAAMALALALQNRGFTEIGSSGIKARDLSAVSEDVAAENISEELLAELVQQVDTLRLQVQRSLDVSR